MSQESVVVVDVEEPSASSQFEDQRGDFPSHSFPAMSQESIVVVDVEEPSASSQFEDQRGEERKKEEHDYFRVRLSTFAT